MTLPTMVGRNDRAQTSNWCRRIDDGPFHALAVGERIAYPNLELMTTLGFAAAATERVMIEPTIVVLPAHPELLVAKQLASIDVLSGGRMVVGVGVGGRDEDFVAMGGRSVSGRHRRLDAQVATMRRVWDQEVLDGMSEPIGPKPVGPMPLLSGSLGPKAVARASAWAAGVNGFSLDPVGEDWPATFERVREAWAAAGGSSRPYMATSFWYSVDEHHGPAVLQQYAEAYLAVFGEEMATAMASMTSASSVGAVLEALDRIEQAGGDEVFLVPTSTDLAHLDVLIDALGSRARRA